MPAGNPVINTASSFPSPVDVGRDAPHSATPGTLVADRSITRRTAAVPTNEQRRATAKRKLERQLERRAAKERKRRIYTIVGSAVAALVVIAAVVATVVVTKRRLRQPDRVAATTTPTSADQRRPVGAGTAARLRGARRPRRQLPVPGVAADKASKPINPPRTGKVPDRPGAGQRQHGDQPGQHRPAAGQRQVTVHGQQLRQPGPAGLLQRHPVPPADHLRGAVGAAVRRPDGPGHRRPGLPVRQRVPDQPVPARRPQAARSR